MAVRLRSGSKKYVYSCIGLVFFYYMFLRSRKYNEVFEFSIYGADPKTVWEFWGDFSNYPKLNPTVTDFEILSEKGNFENWEYSVRYEETLTSFTMVPVQIWATFQVTPEKRHGKSAQPFRIKSTHTTCVFLFCSDTDADMIFVKNNQSRTKATTVIENVDIECIPLLATFCKKEFYTQRKEILEQINQIDFSTI